MLQLHQASERHPTVHFLFPPWALFLGLEHTRKFIKCHIYIMASHIQGCRQGQHKRLAFPFQELSRTFPGVFLGFSKDPIQVIIFLLSFFMFFYHVCRVSAIPINVTTHYLYQVPDIVHAIALYIQQQYLHTQLRNPAELFSLIE